MALKTQMMHPEPMLVRLLKLPWRALRDGRIEGQAVTRNPLAWIPFALLLPVVLLLGAMLFMLYLLFLPLIALWGLIARSALARRVGILSEPGILFPRAYRRRTIAWSEIRSVARHHDPKFVFYRLRCEEGSGRIRERTLLLNTQPDADMFERELLERGIPLTVHDWRQQSGA
ncbi:MAG: hypothetical protein L0387_00395 [Acidobacteria bacterium]|nr:hypothetical protein [Acidobacteriota bacterium]